MFFSVQQLQKESYKDLFNQWSTYYTSTSLVRVDDMFSVQLLPEKVTNIIQIKEALNNKAHITQIRGCFFLCNFCSRKLWSSIKSRKHKKSKTIVHYWLKLELENLFYTILFYCLIFNIWGPQKDNISVKHPKSHKIPIFTFFIYLGTTYVIW